jgi:hypothetical protein
METYMDFRDTTVNYNPILPSGYYQAQVFYPKNTAPAIPNILILTYPKLTYGIKVN